MMGIESEVSLEGAATFGGDCALCGNLGGGDIFGGVALRCEDDRARFALYFGGFLVLERYRTWRKNLVFKLRSNKGR